MLLTRDDIFNLVLNTIKSLRFIKYRENTINPRYLNDKNNPFFELIDYDNGINTIFNIFINDGGYILGDGFYFQLLNLVLNTLQDTICNNTNHTIEIYRYSVLIKVCIVAKESKDPILQMMKSINDILNMNPVHKHIGDRYYTLDSNEFYEINEDGELVRIKDEGLTTVLE